MAQRKNNVAQHSIDRDQQEKSGLLFALFGVIQRYWGGVERILHNVSDHRDPRRITYPLVALHFAALLMFVFRLGARRQIGQKLRNGATTEIFRELLGVQGVPHGDTVNDELCNADPAEYQESVSSAAQQFIRSKALYASRFLDRYYLVAIDATGILTYAERHCEHCLTQTQAGKTIYYHLVLEAKLVTPHGLVVSLMSEFIENPGKNMDKQDCELRAFYRLVARLKKRFPRLPIVLLLDGLYAGGPTLQRCNAYRWKAIIVLKDASMPLVNQEFETLCELTPENHLSWNTGVRAEIHQDFRWINDIVHRDQDGVEHTISVLECLDTRPQKGGVRHTTKFKWITTFKVSKNNVIDIANEGGRVRWKIENEGFNVQKNGGYGLEHAYTKNENAGKIFYFLLQIAHLIVQLVEHGSLLRQVFPRGHPTGRDLAFRLLEAWRNTPLIRPILQRTLRGDYQIRLTFT